MIMIIIILIVIIIILFLHGRFVSYKEECFIRYRNTEKRVMKNQGAAQLRSVWISDETLFRVFDMAPQSIHNSWRNSKQNFTEFYDDWDHMSKPPSCRRFSFSLMND